MTPVPYVGKKDRLVDFPDDSISFANQEKLGRTFKVTVVNTTGADQTIVLFPNFLSTGNIVNGGTIATGITCSSRPKTIPQLLEKVKRSPIGILSIDVASDNATQLTELFNISRTDLFKGDRSETVDINLFKDKYQQDSKSALVKFEDLNADGDTELSVIVPGVASGTTTTTFTITFGGSVSLPYALKESQRLAKANLNA